MSRASFVIPAYNSEAWISKTIWSARNQTIKQIEIVVVDDGSTDGTHDIAKWHSEQDSRVRLIRTENRGRSAARNLGNSEAKSDIILVLDADDLATRDRVKHTLATFELKKADLVYGAFYVIDTLGRTHNRVPCKAFDPEACKSSKLNYICHSTVAYTKKLATDVTYSEGVYSSLGLDDWKFQWDAYRKGYALKHTKSPLAYYRVTEGGISATRDPNEVEKAKEEYLVTL